MRHAFVRALCDAAHENEHIFLLTGDLGFNVLEPFRDQFPDRFLNVGVAEANMMTVASGLSTVGYIPFVYSIAPFATMRPFEQIRIDIALQNRNVKIIGIGGGVAYGKAGATHHSFEDIALMRTLPNMTIVNPSDPSETYLATKAMTAYSGPGYMRLEKNPIYNSSKAGDTFVIGKGKTISARGKIALLVTGTKVPLAQSTALLLEERGLECGIYAFPTLQPFDSNLLRIIIEQCNLLITIEEHSLCGGLASIVSQFLTASQHIFDVRLISFGIDTTKPFISASYETLMEYYRLTPQHIASEAIKYTHPPLD